MDKIVEPVPGMDPTTVLLGLIGVGVLLASFARWWWTAPVVRALSGACPVGGASAVDATWRDDASILAWLEVL